MARSRPEKKRKTQGPVAGRDLSNARRKMREAQFFYWKLMGAGRRSSTEPGEAFQCYLSAFLCAARRVAEVATHDLRSGRPITTWEQTLANEDRSFLRLMKGLRDTEVHRRGLEAKRQPFEFLEDSFPALNLVPERFLVAGDRQYGALTACGRYLGLLADMLHHIDADSRG